jgi:hypothetical protein
MQKQKYFFEERIKKLKAKLKDIGIEKQSSESS